MFARIGTQGLQRIFNAAPAGVRVAGTNVTNSIKTGAHDIVDILSKRARTLNLYNSNGGRDYLFRFHSNGEITTILRGAKSQDLNFLHHVKAGEYTLPRMNRQGTHAATKEAIEQSNNYAKEIISENEHFIDGFRYSGPKAQFNELGQNISRFSNGNQEIVIIDKTADKILNQTIQAFKNRISGKNLTESQKIDEMMKFVDEVFSVSKDHATLGKLTANMHNFETKEVLLGEILNSGTGMCRHRALLTKLLGDEVGLATRFIQGTYSTGGHAWNEIMTKNGSSYLFDAMHGNIFNISNTSKNLDPRTFYYKITDAKNADKLVLKYLDNNTTVGTIYRSLGCKGPFTINSSKFLPTVDGYIVTPSSAGIKINGKEIFEETKLATGDWVQIKDLGFQIK